MPLTRSSNTSCELLIITVARSWVMKTKDARFVFVDTFSDRINSLSSLKFGNRNLYMRFRRGMSDGCYNTSTIYGLTAIDIDRPYAKKVPTQLKFVVVDSPDDVEAIDYAHSL